MSNGVRRPGDGWPEDPSPPVQMPAELGRMASGYFESTEGA